MKVFIWIVIFQGVINSATYSISDEEYFPFAFPDAIYYNCESNYFNIANVSAIIKYVNQQINLDITDTSDKFDIFFKYCQAIESKLGFSVPYESTIKRGAISFDTILYDMLGRSGVGVEEIISMNKPNDHDACESPEPDSEGCEDFNKEIFVSKIICSEDSIKLTPVYIKLYRQFDEFEGYQSRKYFESIGHYKHHKFILTRYDLVQIKEKLKIKNH